MAVYLNRANGNYINFGTSVLDYNSAYTWMLWFRLHSDTNALGHIIKVWNTTGSNGKTCDDLEVDSDGTTLRLFVNDANTGVGVTGTNLTSGTWYHLALVRESLTSCKVYRNGVLDITNTKDVTGRTAANEMVCGRWDGTFTEYIDGEYQAMKAWTGLAMTADQIKGEIEVYERKELGSPYGWWPMLAGSGERVRDYSGNSHTWTENGGAITDVDPPPVAWGASPYVRQRPIVAKQYAYPTSDVAAGSWTDQGGGTTNLYQKVDEVSPDDTDYLRSAVTPAVDVLNLGLGTLTDPVSSSGHVLRYRLGHTDPGAAIDYTVRLMQTTTEIANWTHTGIASWVNGAQTLTGGQADAITDYTALRVKVEANDPIASSYPNIVAVNGGNSGANATSHTVNLPDGSNVVGRMIIALFATDGTTTPTWPLGWVSLSGPTSAQAATFEIRYKIIDGTEGYPSTGATITVSTGATSEGSAHTTYLLRNFDTTLTPFIGSPANGTTTPYDCPNCNPGVSRPYLWIAAVGNDGNVAISAAPATYANLRNDRWANSNGCGVGSSYKTATATSDDPASATMGADGWIANTIAIAGAPAARGFVSWIAFETPVAATSTQYNLTVDGTLTMSGLLVKQSNKPLVGTLTDSGLLLKQAGKVYAGTLSQGGSLTQQTGKNLDGTLIPAGALIKQANKLLSGTLTSSGTLSSTKVTLLSLAGTLSGAGALVKQVQKEFVGTLASSAALVKQMNKTLAGTLASSGALTTIKAALLSLSGTLTMSGALVKNAGKALSGTLTGSAILIKETHKAISGTLTTSGALVISKLTQLSLSGTLTMSGMLAKTAGIHLSGALMSVGGLVKRVGKTLSGALSAAGAFVGQYISGGGLAGPPIAEPPMTINAFIVSMETEVYVSSMVIELAEPEVINLSIEPVEVELYIEPMVIEAGQ